MLSCARLIHHGSHYVTIMPGKGYSNLTVKASTYYKFVMEAERARWSDSTLDNSSFLDMLLEGGGGLNTAQGTVRTLTRHGGFDEIEKMAERIGILRLVPEISKIYEQARPHTAIQNRQYLVCSALYIACKQNRITKSLSEIAETAGIDTNQLFSCATSVAMKLDLSISGTDAISFVQRIADRVNSRGFKYKVSEKSIKDAVAVLEQIKDNPIVGGRSPKTMAAWALYRACRRNCDNISQKSIASSADIVETNLHRMSAAFGPDK